MENYSVYITLAVMIFMIIEFIRHRLPYGVTAMLCVVILTFTKVIDVETALSGFSNTNTVLVATMVIIASALGKTSLASSIRKRMSVIQGKNGTILVFLICVFTAILTQLMGMTAVMSIMLLIIESLDDDTEVSQSRMLFLVAAINAAWFGRIPLGMGAALPLATNAFYSGIVNDDPQYLLGMFDLFKVGIIPTICLTVFCLLAWRLIPKQIIDVNAFSFGSGRQQEALSRGKEAVIYIVFLCTMISFFFSKQLGNFIYIIPIAGILALIYTRALSVREVGGILSSDIVFMIAGVLVISTALNTSGAGQAIGNAVLKILGNHPSSIMITLVFAIATVIMTSFLSNTATMAILIPIAASTAMAGGMNPKAVVLVICIASCFAIALPTGCVSATIAYSVGDLNPGKTLKFTLPFLLIGIVSLVISASLLYPAV